LQINDILNTPSPPANHAVGLILARPLTASAHGQHARSASKLKFRLGKAMPTRLARLARLQATIILRQTLDFGLWTLNSSQLAPKKIVLPAREHTALSHHGLLVAPKPWRKRLDFWSRRSRAKADGWGLWPPLIQPTTALERPEWTPKPP